MDTCYDLLSKTSMGFASGALYGFSHYVHLDKSDKTDNVQETEESSQSIQKDIESNSNSNSNLRDGISGAFWYGITAGIITAVLPEKLKGIIPTVCLTLTSVEKTRELIRLI